LENSRDALEENQSVVDDDDMEDGEIGENEFVTIEAGPSTQTQSKKRKRRTKSKGNKTNKKSKNGENWNEHDWDSAERESLVRRALPIEPDEEDFRAFEAGETPMTAMQYILSVRSEAEKCPDVMVATHEWPRASCQATSTATEDVPHALCKWGKSQVEQEKRSQDRMEAEKKLLPSSEWINTFIDEFLRLQQVGVRISKVDHFMHTNLSKTGYE
jgi:hypothetical protein